MYYITYCDGYKCHTWITELLKIIYSTLDACFLAANEVVILMDASAWCESVIQ